MWKSPLQRCCNWLFYIESLRRHTYQLHYFISFSRRATVPDRQHLRVKNVSSPPPTEAFLSLVFGETHFQLQWSSHERFQRREEIAVFGPGLAIHKFLWLIWRSRWHDDNSEDIKVSLI